VLALALTINIAALIWFFIFLENTYLGIFLGVSVIVWFFVFLKKKQDQLEEDFKKKFAGQNIRLLDKKAVLKAQESNGYSQSQGMGYLVLTDNELYYEMGLLDIIISIPVSSITEVGKANRLLGVGSITTMLKVEFKDNKGNKDSIAVIVKELELWENKIRKIIN